MPFGEAVGVESERPGVREGDDRGAPVVVAGVDAERDAVLGGDLQGLLRGGEQGFVVARQVEGGSGGLLIEGEERAGGEQGLGAALRHQQAFHEVQQFGAVVSGQDERAPRDPQADTEGGGVGTVSAYVTDDGVQHPVVSLDDVEEVAAEQGLFGAGQVAGGHRDGGGVEEGPGQQSAFEPGVLLRALPGRLGFGRRALGVAPVDGVAHRAAQQFGFDFALDEVILGSGGHRFGARLLLGQAGQDDHRGVRGHGADGGDRIGARHVGQVEVEENAVDGAGCEFRAGFGQRDAGGELEAQLGVVEELLDEQGVGGVVLYEEDAVDRFVRSDAVDVGEGCGHGAGSAVARVASAMVDGAGGGMGARVKLMRAPSRYSGSTAMVPPWNSTIFLHIARPIPLPG